MARIDDFELIVKLGEGGMGAVYKARQISLDRIVALKVLAPRLAKDQSFVTRFLREARATAKLNHPNIVSGIAVGSADGYHYFAMEFIEGESFDKRIKTGGALPEAEVLRIGAAVASALAHAHSVGIIHRDVKPDNILIMADGTPKLADLGLAKGNESEEDASLTQAGTALGTPHYIAPEQAAGESDVDGRADTYALGCTLYHAATGQTPFKAPTTAVLMMKHMTEKMPHPQSIRPQLSDGFCLVLSRMLARDRNDRYADLKDAARDMEAVLTGQPPAVKPLPGNKSKFEPAPGHSGTKFQRRTGRHAPVEVGNAEAPTTERSGTRHPTGEQRKTTRAAVPPPDAKKWQLIAVGGVALLGVLLFVLFSGSNKNPDKSTPPKSAAAEAPKTPAPAPVAAPPKPVMTVTPPAPKPVVSPAVPPAPKPVVDTPPASGDGIPLVNKTDLSGWKVTDPDWTNENGVLVGKGRNSNGCIWKFNSVPANFEIRFDADPTRGFYWGWSAGDNRMVYIRQGGGHGSVHITDYFNNKNTELATANKLFPGKRSWRVVVVDSTIKVYADGELAAETDKASQKVEGNRTIVFYAYPNQTLRISNLEYRVPMK